MTEHHIPSHTLHRISEVDDFRPACSRQSCQQGRKGCPVPDACQLPADDDLADSGKAIVIASVIGVILACVAAVLADHWAVMVAMVARLF